MGIDTRNQTNAALTPLPAFTPERTGLLQRKCACGQHKVTGDKCNECGKREQMLQRRSVNHSESNGVPTILQEVLRSPGQPLEQSDLRPC